MKRINWIDMAKGLAIVCVVLGHSGYSTIELFVNSFHMPLFFIIAGYTFNSKKDASSFITQKSIRLLLPYFSLYSLMYHTTLLLVTYSTTTKNLSFQ